MVQVRPAAPRDAAFLADMLALAADWQPGTPPRAAAAILADPHLARYVADWPRHDDLGVIATDDAGEPTGAAWCRYFTAAAPGYGFVAPTVPEVSIAVVARARNTGVGSRLLRALMDAAEEAGIAQLSLSVEAGNPARRLYERLGFTTVHGSGSDASVTLLVNLAPAER